MKYTNFERAIFFSWYCEVRDCSFCYMSTQLNKKKAIRSKESILAELLLCKKLGWNIGFISGGIGAFSRTKFKDLLNDMYKINKEKFWLNIGALNKKELKDYLPYTKGVVGSLETINKKIHNKVCPSKPIEPYLGMFENALKLKLKTAATIILGLGETIKDFEEFKKIIKKYNISKVHFYSLNPQKGTVFENSKPPSSEYQAKWIKKTREEFPKIDIQFGIWVDRVDRVSELLNAGANSISKFPAIRYFNSIQAKQIEKQAKSANRIFKGSLTKLPNIDWNKEINKFPFSVQLKSKINKKLQKYLKIMVKPKT